ncbi:hypothetical protein [Roseateles albus]|uniref:Transmembrane protein n=1 Tax=Roseateles albus TaxID=2987525 RepID=A0ABT5KGN5_9BURK|nr:hypothetical protein [Roseateles albus]MDC8773061.1 hypothetical protein [Roseateles albus]
MAYSASTVDDMARSRGSLNPAIAEQVNTPKAAASSAVSWAAIVAGAAAAASLSLILLILGVGLGLSSVSPWARSGVSAATFGVSTIVWLTLTQLLASAMGGYLAGRLRTKWTEVHTNEVYFRDTAHGFLSWAVASLATAALLTSVIGSIVGGGVQAGAAMVGGAAGATKMVAGNVESGTEGSTEGGTTGYFIDSLFRRDAALDASLTPSGAVTMEVGRIFATAGRSEALPPEDLRYVGQVVALRTGLSQPEAEKRVATVYAKAQAKAHEAELAAREAADKARKASAYSALWLFISLLIGAFVASLAATYGGRLRDA